VLSITSAHSTLPATLKATLIPTSENIWNERLPTSGIEYSNSQTHTSWKGTSSRFSTSTSVASKGTRNPQLPLNGTGSMLRAT
ncbi:hypothetical protein LTR49_026380, partial [Elasticomyces elasticus]